MVGMADGYAQASGAPGARQPAHRARRRQRDGRDLQRPGEPLAARDHRRPAGALADHAAGEPHQPRRDPDAAPARQVELRAAAGRGRAAGARPRGAPGDAAAEGPDVRLDPDGRLGRRGRRRLRARRDRAPHHGPRAPATRRRSPISPGGSSAAGNPVLVAGPDVDASGAWDAAVALAERQHLPVFAIPATGGGRIGFPEGHPQLPRRAAAGDRPGLRDARRATT